MKSQVLKNTILADAFSNPVQVRVKDKEYSITGAKKLFDNEGKVTLITLYTDINKKEKE